MVQRLARRAEESGGPRVSVPPKTNFSIMFTLPVNPLLHTVLNFKHVISAKIEK